MLCAIAKFVNSVVCFLKDKRRRNVVLCYTLKKRSTAFNKSVHILQLSLYFALSTLNLFARIGFKKMKIINTFLKNLCKIIQIDSALST